MFLLRMALLLSLGTGIPLFGFSLQGGGGKRGVLSSERASGLHLGDAGLKSSSKGPKGKPAVLCFMLQNSEWELELDWKMNEGSCLPAHSG